jgi:hypothetical protein
LVVFADYSEHHAATYHFPDAYYGKNTKIADTLNNLLLKSPQVTVAKFDVCELYALCTAHRCLHRRLQNWQTTVGLPFFRIESTVVEWDEIKYDVRLLQRVPYEGVSRMQVGPRTLLTEPFAHASAPETSAN